MPAGIIEAAGYQPLHVKLAQIAELILILSHLLNGNPILLLRRNLKALNRLKNCLARVGSLASA
jgi:hypothetical protein